MSRSSKPIYEFGPFRVEGAEYRLWRDGVVIPLDPKTFGILLVLLKSQGHLVEKEEFMREVWPDAAVEEKNIDHNIYLLRQKLGDDAKKPQYIQTVPRKGYRFLAGVAEVSDQAVGLIVEEHTKAHIVIEEETGEEATYAAQAMPATRALGPAELRALPTDTKSLRPTGPALLAVGLLLALGGALIWQRRSPNPPETPTPSSPQRSMKTMPLTSFPDEEFDSALSPDGRLVAFAWKGGSSDRVNIYVQQVGAGSPLRLTTAQARDARPTWSPDGRHIAFIRGSHEAGQSGIYLIPSLGGHERRLFAATHLFGLDWSPDGKQLAFALSNPAQEPSRITLVAIDSLEVRNLTEPPADSHGDVHPVYSPDGQTLSFIRFSDYASELFLIPSGGGQPRQVTFDNRRIDGVAWTPSGRRLIFSSNRGGGYNLWRVSAEGGVPELVAGVGDDAHDPSISRSGDHLTYTHQVIDTNIWRVPIRGVPASKEARVKLVDSTRRDENPRLSPDGRRIVFQSNRSGSRELWVCDSDGANQVQLTFLNGPVTSNARWSPDGRQLAFDSRPDGHADLFVMSAEGGPLRRLTAGQGDNLAPSWSHDGSSLYFGSNRNGSWQIWKMPTGGGDAVQVTRDGGYEAIEALDGQYLYYNKYGYYTVGVYQLSTAGGDEVKILDLPQLDSFGDWTLTREGIYFIHRYDSDGKPASPPSIDFHDFVTRRTVTVATLKQDPTSNPGLSVSPDGHWLIYSNDDYRSLDIILVENFSVSGND